MGDSRKTKMGSMRDMVEEMNKQDLLRNIRKTLGRSPEQLAFSQYQRDARLLGMSAIAKTMAQAQENSRLLGMLATAKTMAQSHENSRLLGMSTIAKTMAQAQEGVRAFDMQLRRMQSGTESLDYLTSPTLPESLDSALRPTGANPFISTALHPIIHTPKYAPRKTDGNPIARLESSGHPIAADYSEEAIELLELGYYKNSAHSSICAIEAVMKEFNPNKQFGEAIDQMRSDGVIHPAFAETVKKLWGYCNRPGMRHADYESSPFPAVGDKEARMLIGICPSIAAYLADAQN